jgi:hypothetical protein
MAQMVIEAEKSHSLPSTRQRLRKASDIFQYESSGLRTRITQYSNPNPQSGEDERFLYERMRQSPHFPIILEVTI